MIRDRTIQLLFGASALLLIVSAIVGFVGLPQEPGGPLVIRFDTSGDEAALLGGAGMFYAVLGIVAAMFTINFFLALEVYNREKFLSYLLAAGTLAVTLLFVVAAAVIASAN